MIMDKAEYEVFISVDVNNLEIAKHTLCAWYFATCQATSSSRLTFTFSKSPWNWGYPLSIFFKK
jgi:hypothetical protein